MVGRIAFSIIAFSAVLTMPCYGSAEKLETTLVSEEYELDLGPQGKEKNREIYGYGTFDSDVLNIVAGELGTWEFTYHVGKMGVDDGGRVFLLFNAVADWGKFQTDDPTRANYVTAHSTADVELGIHFDPRHAGLRPYWGGLVITVGEGDLVEGDEVTITLGDRGGGGPGSRAPTITPHLESEFRFMVDPLNSVLPVRLLDSPRIRIVSSGPAKLEVLWPSERSTSEETWLLVKAKDKWGNPSTSYTGTIEIEAEGLEGLPRTYTFTERDAGYHRFEGVRTSQPGEYRVTVRDVERGDLSAQSNLMVARSTLDLRHYCGDLHGQNIRGSANLNQYASYAYGFAGIDFMSWAVNDFHITKKTWGGIQDTSAKFNLPGRFVAFPGYEWSATTGRGGDHNIIYLEEGQTLFRSGYAEPDLRGYSADTDRYVMDSLIASLDSDDVFLMPHIGGRRANLDFYNSEFMPFIEVYSGHGQFEWFLREALNRGLKVGFTASSDDVFGKLGDSPPGSQLFAVHGGITCTFARDLSRQGLWEAFKQRRVYGTTGERIYLRFKAGKHWLGEEIKVAGNATFSVDVFGTAGIERVELFKGTKVVYRHREANDASTETGVELTRVKVIWRGAASRERRRQTLWSGQIRLDKGTISSIAPYRLDFPTEVLRLEGEGLVVFDTMTAGDEDGVILDIATSEHSVLNFEANYRSRSQFGSAGIKKKQIKFSIPLNQLTFDDKIYPLDGVDREIVLRKIATKYPARVQFSWVQEKPVSGETAAYWVRVQQVDGATAWSSPIFVEHRGVSD